MDFLHLLLNVVLGDMSVATGMSKYHICLLYQLTEVKHYHCLLHPGKDILVLKERCAPGRKHPQGTSVLALRRQSALQSCSVLVL